MEYQGAEVSSGASKTAASNGAASVRESLSIVEKHQLYTWDKSNANEWRYRTHCEYCNKDFTIGLTVSAIIEKDVKTQVQEIEVQKKCGNCRKGGV